MPAIETGRPICIRCGNPIFNAFRREPWCDDCSTALQLMSFNGEDFLRILATIMPEPGGKPGMVRVVPVEKLHEVALKVLIHEGIMLPKDDDNDADSGPKKSLLIGG